MYIIVGIDFYNGDNFLLEVIFWWVRLYFLKGFCGNIVLRFFVNI